VKKRKKTEIATKENGQEWQKTFDAIVGLVFIQDKNFVITRANKAFCDALKLKPEQVIGKKCHKILHKTDKPWPNCPFVKTLEDNRAHIEEVNDPGIGIPLLVTTSPIFDDTGEIAGSVHVAMDISKQKKTEEKLKEKIMELEKFRNISIGRELKMKELKEKIHELEEKAKKK